MTPGQKTGRLRRRITTAFVLLTFSAVLLLFGLLLLESNQGMSWALFESHKDLAAKLVPEIEPLVSGRFDHEQLIRTLYRLQAEIPTAEIFILDGERELKDALSPSAAGTYRTIFRSSAGATKPVVRVRTIHWNIIDGIFVGTPLVVEGRPGFLFVRVDAQLLRPTLAMLFDLNVIFFLGWWMLVALVAALPLGLIIASRITRPLERMNRGLEAFAGGDYSERLPAAGKSEFDRHAEAFNQMAETIGAELSALKEQDQMLRNLLRQISDSLSAPVHSLAADLAEMSAAPSSSQRRRKLMPLIEHCEHINEHVNGAFAVARRSGRIESS